MVIIIIKSKIKILNEIGSRKEGKTARPLFLLKHRLAACFDV